MINKIRKIAKKALGEDIKIVSKEFKKENLPIALENYINDNPDSLSNYKKIGRRKDGKDFYPAVKKIEIGYNLLYRDLHKYDCNGVCELNEYSSIRSGTPLKSKPFPLCREYLFRTIFSKYLYRYPSISGHPSAKQHIVNYLLREGFSDTETKDYNGLGIENVVFTCSTTHAYNMVLQTIARDEDVLLVTGPNYGLFAVEPEKMNIRVEVLDLKAEDNWYVNPKDLSDRIDELNTQLKKEFAGKLDYTPRVVAFLNMNPHNPLGKVMNNKNIDILKGIGDVCLEKGIFIIDDLVYRDLTFDQNDLAVPIASMPKYFNNTITLLGLSKSYGLAGIRAGVIVAPIPLCNGISDVIFSTMDSIPLLQIQAVTGAYNATNRRYRIARKYFKKVIDDYIYRLNLMETLVNGIDSVQNKKNKRKIIRDVKKYFKGSKAWESHLEGIPGIKLRMDAYPEGGFFAIIDFTALKGKKDGNIVIQNDAQFVEYLYKKTKIKCIMGLNMSWPNEDEIIARASFSLDIDDIIMNFDLIKKAIQELK